MDEQIENINTNPICSCISCIIYIFQIVAFILICIHCSKKQYNDGYFLDVLDNLNKNPIKNIEIISENNSNCENLFLNNTPIYKWKEKYFKFERINSNLLNLLNKENNSIEIGTDSLENKLYSNETVINFIEITNSSEPSINKLNYSVITYQIDSKTFLHYSNNYVEGRVLVDIRIGLEKKPCDDITKNENLFISDYSCKDNDLDLGNTYQKLDETIIKDYYNEATDLNQKIYLYSRTYINAPEEYKKYNKLEEIKNYENKISKLNLVFQFIMSLVNMIFLSCFSHINQNTTFSFILFLLIVNLIIKMIFPIINISYLSIAISNYNKYNNFIFSKLNHGISDYYKKYIWFIKYDIVILTSLILAIIPGVIAFVSMFGILLTLIGKKVIDTMSEKLKKREERKQRIKKYKDEIKQLENNPDIPISKINEKRLLFFK